MNQESARSAKLEVYRDRAVAADYDQRWHGAVGRARDARKARALRRALSALTEAAQETPRSLLDLPCGTGRFTALWSDLGLRATGVDLAPEMLAVAREKHARATLLCADGARLPFPDGAFDAVACVRLLHLVRDPAERRRFLLELRRVARLGVIVDWRHGRTLRVWGRRLRWRLGLRDRSPSNPSHAQIRAEMQAAGFRITAELPVRRAPLLSDKLLVVAVPA
ncbi:MAG: class I SAM-dependent methyltransferase [Planctomycetota bacterium]|nr:class I SAM-dependent methyltransferase [Planctomycetota bacterium]